ncbi:diaminopimelate epimerase [Pajaroellobacter abortibovis]|uniref:Diaminopimelate epimerase n=1 Tax=Pajaroellobacter abortibovis TaxID=1882918 RepID=A0A1L6MUQ9_9BACT|nr:diaminopimelate epimerase [Pajaroellobacter abortibovis]APR99243.1 diaminopimelate epimerase [Pajaroellobacter abortibovis]
MKCKHFQKYEGLGNDFILVYKGEEDEESWFINNAKSLCDRHYGIGADGILLLSPTTKRFCDVRMSVINADGSRAEMCGNGIRAVALHRSRVQENTDAPLLIETDQGILTCQVEEVNEMEGIVQVDMGPVQWEGEIPWTFADRSFRLSLLRVGNPHAVTFDPFLEQDYVAMGEQISQHPQFIEGTNVEWVTMRESTSMEVMIWERGVGLTLACGTGACAVAAAACEKGLAPWDIPLFLHLPGGILTIQMRSSDRHALMRGPVRHVYSGEFYCLRYCGFKGEKCYS